MTSGDEVYEGFSVDNVLHSADEEAIHFSLYVPESYDGESAVPLFITLPGYQGLYFNGANQNLLTEQFAFAARDYNEDMIIAAPQLNDWGQVSADQTIALTEYLERAYSIDHVYLEGYSGGGETLSLVMATAPQLYRAVLFCSSQWDGALEPIADAQVPLYLIVGADDEYYGADPARDTAQRLRSLYASHGLSDSEIDSLVVLDVRDSDYFTNHGATNQHGDGANLFARDPAVMDWLFGR